MGPTQCDWCPYVTDQGSWPPWSIEIDQRPDNKFRRDFIAVPSAVLGERTNNWFPCTLRGREAILKWGEGRGVFRGSDWRGDLGGLSIPYVVACAGGMLSTLPCSQHPVLFLTPSFAPGSSKVAVGLFSLFGSFVQNLPQLCMHSYF